MTACLISWLACCATGARASETPDALRIRAGWTAPAAGYYLTDAAMRDTVAGWTEARKIADVRQQALEALREEVRLQQVDLRRQLAELQSEIADERRLWRGRVRRGKLQGLGLGLLLGIGGGYLVKRNNP
jgi:hypothetical protein